MYLETFGEIFPKTAKFLIQFKPILMWSNKQIIEYYCGLAKPRPRPYSLASNYTSWKSLTDKSFTGRQLPPTKELYSKPDAEQVAKLWARKDGKEIPSTDTSVLFGYFAQWFVDSFLRTSLDDRRKNSSNHHIDLCQIYGLSEAKTNILRLKKNGKLRYQLIDGEMYPPYLFSSNVTAERLNNCDDVNDNLDMFGTGGDEEETGLPSFAKLHPFSKLKVMYRNVSDGMLQKMFVTGLEHGNSSIGYCSVNTIFLREHNRICDQLIANEYGKDLEPKERDDFIFEVARNIMIVLLIKIVLEDYVQHIANFNFPFQVDPSIGEGKKWKQKNWISIEFDLLYRWHSLVPDQLSINNDTIPLSEYRFNPKLMVEKKVATILSQSSTQKAGKIGLQNTPNFFFIPMPMVENDIITNSSIQLRTIQMSRMANLQPYNVYRKLFGLKPLTDFSELTDNEDLLTQLKLLYNDINEVEFMVGIYAEKHNKNNMMGELMMRMVAYDAFTHGFSNPLLDPEIFNTNTFTELGMGIIKNTKSFSQIVHRNSSLKDGDVISFTIQ